MSKQRLVIRRHNVTDAPIVVEDFKAVEFYDEQNIMQAFIQELGDKAFAFCSSRDPDWEEAKRALGMNTGDMDISTKHEFFKDA